MDVVTIGKPPDAGANRLAALACAAVHAVYDWRGALRGMARLPILAASLAYVGGRLIGQRQPTSALIPNTQE